MTLLPAVLVLLTSAQPIAGRPANFSHLAGQFKIAVHVEPTAILVEAPLRLRVVITGHGDDPPTRKGLQIFPEDLGDSFYIEPLADADVLDPAARRWEFAWNLRPKSTLVREVPRLALVYWSPTANLYLTSRSAAIAIDVGAEQKSDAAPDATVTPACFQELAPWSPATSRPTSFSPWAFLAALVIAAACWRLARPRAALDPERRRALEAVQAAPSEAAAIAIQFLKDRLPVSSEPTPTEIDAVLKHRGVARAARARWTSLCRSLAAQRFAPAKPITDNAAEAAALIRSLEVSP